MDEHGHTQPTPRGKPTMSGYHLHTSESVFDESYMVNEQHLNYGRNYILYTELVFVEIALVMGWARLSLQLRRGISGSSLSQSL
jgi:hypothetical protein